MLNHRFTGCSQDKERMTLLFDVAKRYWVDGASQAEIAAETGYSRPQISRILAEARQRKVVKVTVQNPIEKTLVLQEQLKKKFKLKGAEITISSAADSAQGSQGEEVADLGAELLLSMMASDSVIAVTNGRAVTGVVNSLPEIKRPEVTIVQAFGEIASEGTISNSSELCLKMAKSLGARHQVLPIPLYMKDPRVAQILRKRSNIALTLSMASHSDIFLTGIGATNNHSSGLIFDKWLDPNELEALVKSGAIGHIGGHHINFAGNHVDGNLCFHLSGVPFSLLPRSTAVIGVAWGAEKIAAIRAALLGKLLRYLVTDIKTAEALVK